MVFRIGFVKVKADKPLPSLITDIKATADEAVGLLVALSWTNPELDNKGYAQNPLRIVFNLSARWFLVTQWSVLIFVQIKHIEKPNVVQYISWT